VLEEHKIVNMNMHRSRPRGRTWGHSKGQDDYLLYLKNKKDPPNFDVKKIKIQ